MSATTVNISTLFGASASTGPLREREAANKPARAKRSTAAGDELRRPLSA